MRQTVRITLLCAVVLTGTAYRRADWRHWIDADHDCLSTRDEVLLAEGTGVVLDTKGCKVVSGEWRDRYSGQLITDPKALDVDHFIPLEAAARSGGERWSAAKKRDYANDLEEADHLIAVSASLNRQKGSKGPEHWRPPLSDAWSWYATTWLAIKERWGLTLTAPECRAVCEMNGR